LKKKDIRKSQPFTNKKTNKNIYLDNNLNVSSKNISKVLGSGSPDSGIFYKPSAAKVEAGSTVTYPHIQEPALRCTNVIAEMNMSRDFLV
jgi:hypothetical protein